MRRSTGNADAPPAGRPTSAWHWGQGNAPSGRGVERAVWTASTWATRQRQQNVCWHGSTRGSWYCVEHRGHVSRCRARAFASSSSWKLESIISTTGRPHTTLEDTALRCINAFVTDGLTERAQSSTATQLPHDSAFIIVVGATLNHSQLCLLLSPAVT